MKAIVEFDMIEKEFQCTRKVMGLIKEKGYRRFQAKEEENIRVLLLKFQPEEVIDFTDGSALIVQVSTGAGDLFILMGSTIVALVLLRSV